MRTLNFWSSFELMSSAEDELISIEDDVPQRRDGNVKWDVPRLVLLETLDSKVRLFHLEKFKRRENGPDRSRDLCGAFFSRRRKSAISSAKALSLIHILSIGW